MIFQRFLFQLPIKINFPLELKWEASHFNGILQKSTTAKTNTDNAQIKERVQLAYLSAISGNQGEVAEEYLIEALNQEFGDGNYDLLEDLSGVTINGKNYGFDGSITTGREGWNQKADGTIENADGTITGIKIGDYVNYNPANSEITSITSNYTNNGCENQTLYLSSYSGGWRVLGVKDGQIELISENLVISNFHLGGRTGYQNAETELNKVAGLFGHGEYASGARSVNIDDINKITGYNPLAEGIKNPTAEQKANGNKYGKGQLDEYGNNVTYSWIGTNYPKYIATNELTGNLRKSHNVTNSNYGEFQNAFSWYNFKDNNWQKSPYLSTANTTNPVEIISLTSTYYYYYTKTLTTSSGYGETSSVGVASGSVESELISGGGDDAYWLASVAIHADDRWVYYNVGTANSNRVDFDGFAKSDGYESSSNVAYRGIRAVVSLESNVQLDANGIQNGVNAWKFKE